MKSDETHFLRVTTLGACKTKYSKHFKNVTEYSCTRIILVTLCLKLSLQKGCYKLHYKLALPLLDGERERSDKASPLQPLSFYPLPLHGTTLPEIGHVFLSSGVKENIWHVFVFVTLETISTSFQIHHQRIDKINGSRVLNELNALKPEMIKMNIWMRRLKSSPVYDLQDFS